MRIIRTLQEWNRSQRGQIIAIVAGGMIVFLGFVALSTDVGAYVRDLRDAQNDVDSSTLAGAKELMEDPTNAAAAMLRAEQWATNNDADGELDWTVDCGTDASGTAIPAGVTDSNGDGDFDTICAGLGRSAPAFFARVLGIDDFPVNRNAAARVVHSAGGSVCPWALRSSDPSDLDSSDGTYLGVEIGTIYPVKVGAGESEWGNFGILKLYDTGSDSYKEALGGGCEKNPENVVLEGETVETETEPGNLGQNTLKCLGNPTNPSQPCDDGEPGYFVYELTDGIHDAEDFGWCDVPMTWDDTTGLGDPIPASGGGYDPNVDGPRAGCGRDAANGRNGRYMMVPIVDGFPPLGGGDIAILGIAVVYIAGWGEWDPDEGEYDRTVPPARMTVYVEFVEEASFEPKDLIGVSDNPLAPLRIILIR